MPSGTTDLVEDLRRTSLFADADPARLSALAARAYVKRFAAGQLVFTQGEPSEHLYVVRRGRVRILVASPHGEELTLTVLGVGDTIGELSMIDGYARSASAQCIEPAELVTVAAADVRSALTTDPALLLAAAAELATMVRRLTGGAADMVFLDLPRRLAKLIAAETVTRGDGSGRADLGMAQAGVAARLGVTRQSLNRALSGLVRRGWVTPDGTGYLVHDQPALRRFADS